MTNVAFLFRMGDSFYSAGVYCKRDSENSKLKSTIFTITLDFAKPVLLVTSGYWIFRR